MSIHLRDTAITNRYDLSLNFRQNHTHDYLRENLESEERIIDTARKTNTLAKPYTRNLPTHTSTTKRQKPIASNKEAAVTWPEQYRKTRGLLNQNSVCNGEEEEGVACVREERTNQMQISQNETKQLEKSLQEVIKSIPQRRNFFQTVSTSQQNELLLPEQINAIISPIEEVDAHPNQATPSKHSRQSEQSQSKQSYNFFDRLKKANSNQDSQKNSRKSANLFEMFKSKADKPRKIEDSNESSSESQEEGKIFEKQKTESNSILKSSAHQKYSLEKILRSSYLYRDYPLTDVKRSSQDIPELKPTIKRISKDYFFKPDRVEFRKMANEPYGESSFPAHQYLCKVNQDATCFYFQDLRSEQLRNLNGIKCTQIKLQKEDKISPHTEYDHVYQRFYLFSNKQQKILVYSELSQELLCKIPVQKCVTNPNLHLCRINGRNFLLLVGGYIRVEKQIAQGNNCIQIFEVNKWFLNLKSRLIKLIIGRINPIFITNTAKNDQSLLILGGNAIAKILAEGVFDFEYEKDINESTNMTGISIDCKEITELFDYEEHTNISNVSVKLADPFSLHSGIVLPFANSFLLALPGTLNLFQIKVFHKEINILEARGSVFLDRVRQYQKRELSLKIQREKLIIFSIGDRGNFHVSSHEGKKNEKCRCCIY